MGVLVDERVVMRGMGAGRRVVIGSVLRTVEGAYL